VSAGKKKYDRVTADKTNMLGGLLIKKYARGPASKKICWRWPAGKLNMLFLGGDCLLV
jgi:hypothetical protein